VTEELREGARKEPKLYQIQDWFEGLSCAPTALAAVSGKPLAEIGVLLQQAADSNGRQIPDRLLANYDLSDTMKAMKLLGSFWLTADTYEARSFEERPTIDEWMASERSSGIKLVFCNDGAGEGHIFAAQDGDVVDTYTKGRCVRFDCVPPSYRKFRVKLTFLILVGAKPGRE
jgi:predicted peroxiredoxin